MNDAGQNDIGDEEMALEAADLSEGNGIIHGRNNRPPVKLSTESRRVEVLAEITFDLQSNYQLNQDVWKSLLKFVLYLWKDK